MGASAMDDAINGSDGLDVICNRALSMCFSKIHNNVVYQILIFFAQAFETGCVPGNGDDVMSATGERRGGGSANTGRCSCDHVMQ